MAADYQKLAQNVDDAAAKMKKAADAAAAQAEATASQVEALERSRAAVDKLEESLFSLDAQAARLSQEQAELTTRVAEAALKRDGFRDLVSATGGAQGGQGLKESSAELAALQKELDRSTAKLGLVGEKSQAAAEALEEGLKAQGKQEGKLGKAQAAQTDAEGRLTAAGGDLAGAQDAQKSSAGASLGGALEAIKTASDALLGSFNSLAGVIGPFVQAFSPALMEQFSMAMKDVTAVIGQALAPVLQVLTGIVREVGAVLNPVMKELQPVFDKLAKALASLLIPIIENAAAMIQTLLPIITLLADALAALTPLFRVISVLQAGLVELFKDMMASLLGSVDTKGAMASFKSAIEETAKVLIRTAAHIARAFGALGFIEGMIKGIEGKTAKKQSSVGMAAPQGATVTDLSGYGNTVATAAFAATGDLGDKEKKTEEWLKDIAGDLKGIKDGPSAILAWAKDYFGPIVEAAKLLTAKLTEAGVTYEKAAKYGEVAAAISPLGIFFRK